MVLQLALRGRHAALDIAPWRQRQNFRPARFALVRCVDPVHWRRHRQRRTIGYAALRIGPWRIALAW